MEYNHTAHKDNPPDNIRVRFAPSPTGLLHVGSFRTALFNWLFARHYGGKFILRIEDTDQTRSRKEFLESQLRDMQWMGLDWDEGPNAGGDFGPYFQTERLDLYKEAGEKLLKEGRAYHCYCTPEELKQQRESASEEGDYGYAGKCWNLTPSEVKNFEKEGRKPCIRFRVNKEETTVVQDLVKGEVPFENRLIDDFVIMKSDGIATYNFAVVIDDHLMKISHVIRGDEHLANTPKQIMLYNALNYPLPFFVHIPIILNEDKTKLSKRKGAVHLLEYYEKGFMKEAMLNFLALLGWFPGEDREILTLEEMINLFSIKGITRHPAVFDVDKLEWMNGQYMASLPWETLRERLIPFLKKIGIQKTEKDDEWWQSALTLYKDRAKTLVELADHLSYFFKDIEEYEPAGVKKHFKGVGISGNLKKIAEQLEKTEIPQIAEMERIVRDLAEQQGISAGKLIHPVRLACTGRTATPPLFDVMYLIGKEEVVKRLRKAADFSHHQGQQK